MPDVNMFWKITRVAHSIQHWANKLYVAGNSRNADEVASALSMVEKSLGWAKDIDLSLDTVGDGEPPADAMKYAPSNKFCHCCGAWRKLEPLRCEFGVDAFLIVQDYKPLQRGDGRIYEMSPQIIGHAGVYRNGGTCDDHHICTDCLTMGLRSLRDQLNEVLSEEHCIPVPLQKLEQPTPEPAGV